MQTKTGGADVTTATITAGRQVRFVYPGRAKAYTTTVDTNNIGDVYRSPPQAVDLEGTVTITYTNAKQNAPGNLWAPTGGCTMTAKFQGQPLGVGQLIIKAMDGYRAVNSGVTLSASGTAGDGVSSLYGYRLYGGTTATLSLAGGPADPGGTTKTLEWSSEPAFTTTAGQTYWRNVAVTAAIPTQDSLPV